MLIESTEVNEIFSSNLKEGQENKELGMWLHGPNPLPYTKVEVTTPAGVIYKRVTHFTVNSLVFELEYMLNGLGVVVTPISKLPKDLQDFYRAYNVEIPKVLKDGLVEAVITISSALR
jgi:hypothetical protein